MVEMIEPVKCLHGVACSLMVSLLLSLAIQANIGFSSSTCDPTGLYLEKGDTQCVYTNERIWALSIFYSGAFIFFLGSLATCQSSGYVTIAYMIGLIGWLAVIGGYTIYNSSDKSLGLLDAFNILIVDVIRDKWGVYASILRWVLGICGILAFVGGLLMTIYYISYGTL